MNCSDTICAGAGRRSWIGGARLRRIVAGLPARLAETWRLWRRRVRTRRQLAEMDAHMLKDIGLDANAVWREVDKPFWMP